MGKRIRSFDPMWDIMCAVSLKCLECFAGRFRWRLSECRSAVRGGGGGVHREVHYSIGCRLELYYNGRGWGLRVSYGFPICEYVRRALEGRGVLVPSGRPR